jgi:peptide/nickel transport system permease protein
VLGYIVRRLAQAVVVVLGVTVLAFVLRQLLPGNLARDLDPRATVAQEKVIDAQLGLNHPLPVQYFKFLDQLIHGNLGYSYIYNQTVDSLVQHEILRDVVLLGLAFIISVLLAVPVGLLQAVRRNRAADYVGTTVAFFFYALPDFLLGILLVAVFADHFHFFDPTAPNLPITGVLSHFWRGLTLPLVTEILVGYAAYSRFMRSSAIDSLTQDYIRTARAKGLSERAVLFRHVLRNSLIPMATLIGLSLPVIFTSGLLIEAVFNFNGVALQFYTSSTRGDFPTVFGLTVLIGAFTVIGNLLADIAYAVLDPRVRYS